jgi:hypothetical protein
MSDEILEEPELETQPTFANYIQATGEIVEEFRQYLNEETDRLTRVVSRQLGRDYEFGSAFPRNARAFASKCHGRLIP